MRRTVYSDGDRLPMIICPRLIPPAAALTLILLLAGRCTAYHRADSTDDAISRHGSDVPARQDESSSDIGRVPSDRAADWNVMDLFRLFGGLDGRELAEYITRVFGDLTEKERGEHQEEKGNADGRGALIRQRRAPLGYGKKVSTTTAAQKGSISTRPPPSTVKTKPPVVAPTTTQPPEVPITTTQPPEVATSKGWICKGFPVVCWIDNPSTTVPTTVESNTTQSSDSNSTATTPAVSPSASLPTEASANGTTGEPGPTSAPVTPPPGPPPTNPPGPPPPTNPPVPPPTSPPGPPPTNPPVPPPTSPPGPPPTNPPGPPTTRAPVPTAAPTAVPAPPQTTVHSGGSKSKLKPGHIAVIGVVCFIILVVIVVIVACVCYKRRQSPNIPPPPLMLSTPRPVQTPIAAVSDGKRVKNVNNVGLEPYHMNTDLIKHMGPLKAQLTDGTGMIDETEVEKSAPFDPNAHLEFDDNDVLAYDIGPGVEEIRDPKGNLMVIPLNGEAPPKAVPQPLQQPQPGMAPRPMSPVVRQQQQQQQPPMRKRHDPQRAIRED